MSQEQTVEGVDAEAAVIRSQLLNIGADIRRRVDPSALADRATASISERAKSLPNFLRKESSPIGLILLGGAVGAVVTGMVTKPRITHSASATAPAGLSANGTATSRPNVRKQLQAGLLSAVGLGLGYVAGHMVPSTSVEDAYLGQPKEILRQQLNGFIETNTQGMKKAALNIFGASRLSATALIALAIVGQALLSPQQKVKRDPA